MSPMGLVSLRGFSQYLSQAQGRHRQSRDRAGLAERGANGVGLYRTEFLYLSSDTEPSEEDHYRAYASYPSNDRDSCRDADS